jgi:hypothetical protein
MAVSDRTTIRVSRHAAVLLAAQLLTASLIASADDDAGGESFVAVRAGRIITLAGQEYLQGEIVLVDGKIRLVGQGLEYPKSAERIEARGEVVMPGMIHARSRWNLPGYSRSGLHGDRDAAREVFLDQIDWQPLLESGFTTVAFYPDGTGVTGPSAVVHTAGPADARHLGSGYLRITMTSPERDKKVLREAIDKARKEIEKVDKARKEWEEKQKQAQQEAAKKEAPEKKEGEQPDGDKPPTSPPSGPADGQEEQKKEAGEQTDQKKEAEEQKFTPPEIDPAVLPFVKWLRDKQGPPLLFELSNAAGLLHLEDAVAKAPEIPVTLLYLTGSISPDYHHVMQQLGEREATVLVTPFVGSLPDTVTRYNLPGELARSGCSPVLPPVADSPTEVRSFRVRLADLVRAGLPRDEALKAVTLYAAEALGMADRLGTIEPGKCADLVFLDGDPLDPHTRVTRVMIDGRIVWKASQ